MKFLGGGERLCCDTIRALLSMGHDLTLLSETFDQQKTEDFFGYDGLFERVHLLNYPPNNRERHFGTSSHLIHHLRGQTRALNQSKHTEGQPFDLIFSTQDPGYIPDLSVPVLQWGYFPRYFPDFPPGSLLSLPLHEYYRRKISRIGLVLAISRYSKLNLDLKWSRPSALIYPACNMVRARVKRNLVVTVSRAIPAKRLELFWQVASLCPNYEFAMLLTQDPGLIEYSKSLSRGSPVNGRTIFNPQIETYHKFLGEARVYLHFMHGEHFGITIVEAMSAGCVPVVHDSGGPKEIINEETGFRWQSIEEVPEMVEAAMKSSPSSASRLRAEEFSFERFEKRLSEILSESHA
ncbi:glycosyltransferase [Candidatus Bathyarchaeota archaeon]|nr:MAG: glycosyltransferase [Candidatus Bathyarchaeota archaeon]